MISAISSISPSLLTDLQEAKQARQPQRPDRPPPPGGGGKAGGPPGGPGGPSGLGMGLMTADSASVVLQAQEGMSAFSSSRALLDAGDGDGDGMLGKSELGSLAGASEDDDVISSVFNLLDADGDGRVDATELDQARDRG